MGPPGTGKTALVRAFAEDLDMPLFSYSLGELRNNELQRSWDEMGAHVPCIALFEDIDNVFHGRENVFKNNDEAEILKKMLNKEGSEEKKEEKRSNIGSLSFDCLLNCLDGVQKPNGIFVVITTNHIEYIDEAIGQPRTLPDGTVEFISSRPGRIDKAIELTYMTNADKMELAKRILVDCEAGITKIEEFVAKHPELKETPAQFQERCSQIALAYFWQSQFSSSHEEVERMTKKALLNHEAKNNQTITL